MSFVAEKVEVMLAVNIFFLSPWITFIGLSTTYFGSESESTQYQWLIWTRTDSGQLINKVSGYLLVQKHCSVSVGAEFRSALEADTIGLQPLCHNALIADQKISNHLKMFSSRCSALDVQL